MTTPIFFLFFLYAFVLAKRSMKKIDTLHNNFFEKNDKFYFKKFNLIFNLIFFFNRFSSNGKFILIDQRTICGREFALKRNK
jgi:hypothetical protein